MALSDDLNVIPKLFGDAVEQLGKLVQNEAELARAELSQKLAQAGIGAAFVGLAGLFSVPVLVLLLIAFALWLTQLGFAPVTAHLLAAAAGAVVALILGLMGMSYLKPANLKPRVTMREVERDIATAKELVR